MRSIGQRKALFSALWLEENSVKVFFLILIVLFNLFLLIEVSVNLVSVMLVLGLPLVLTSFPPILRMILLVQC